MYYKAKVRDSIRIPPELFGQDITESIKTVVDREYVGRIDRDLGVIVGAVDTGEINESHLMVGDGAAYLDTELTLLTYKPQIKEIAEGSVREIAEFGAFISIGPMDGLVHVSQIMEDFVSFNEKENLFSGKESKRNLKLGDLVKTRIVTVSRGTNVLDTKIGLTMRQGGLGALHWPKADEKKKTTEKKEPKKETKEEKK